MPSRYTDSVFNKGAYAGAVNRDARTDFLPRGSKSKLFVWLLVLIFCLSLGVTSLVMVLNKMALISSLCLMLFLAGWYVITEIVRSRDLILATEFQNAMFASALGFSNKFCLIIKHDGSVVYMDNGFQKMFPELVKERMVTLDGMLKHGKVEPGDKEKIYSALDRGVYDKIIFDMLAENKKRVKIVMSFEPVIRPSGFILLRGRDFVEKRTRDSETDDPNTHSPGNPLLNKSSITLFAYVMDRMNTGVYMTDPSGILIYANRLIEQWLAYRESEIITTNLSLKDIVYQGGPGPDTISPENFEGEASLRKKEGGLIKAFINQKVILGDDQQVLGCVAMINTMVEIDSSIKKALW